MGGDRSASATHEMLVRRGGCRQPGVDPGWFFPAGKGDYLPTHNRALLVCATCPVVDECLEFAEVSDAREGVWGGVEIGRRMRPARARKLIAQGNNVREPLLTRAVEWLARAMVERNGGVRVRSSAPARLQMEQVAARVRRQLAVGRLPFELGVIDRMESGEQQKAS